MSLLTLLVQGAVIYVVTWVSWRVLSSLLAKSPLDKVPGPPSPSFLTGHLRKLFNRYGWDFQREMAEEYGTVVKYNGLLGARTLFVFDPVALNSVVVKHQDVYEETEFFLLLLGAVLGPGLLATVGDHHRKQRKLLNPIFNTNNMRYMLPIFYQVTHRLRDVMAERVKDGPDDIDLFRWLSRTALELIGQGGLGHSFDPLTEDAPPNEFADAVKSFQEIIFSLSRFRKVIPTLFRIGSESFRRRVVELVPIQAVQRARETSDTVYRCSKEVFEAKKLALEQGDETVLQQSGEGKDMVSTLMRANMAASEEDRLPESELLGQMSTLIFAATDTTSSALSRVLHLLTTNPDVQQKLREQIIAARDGRELIPYDELSALPYLDAVCRESLRLFPPLAQVFRTTREDIVMPLSAPIRATDGSMLNDIFVPKGTDIAISIMAANRNTAIWGPDANEWKPERWLSPLPDMVTQAHIPGIYSNLMTFLGGGRSCIGFKFSQLEMKVVLAVLVETFSFSLSDKPVYWNLAGVQYPTIGTVNTKGSMPLKVTLFKA